MNEENLRRQEESVQKQEALRRCEFFLIGEVSLLQKLCTGDLLAAISNVRCFIPFFVG